MSVQRLRITSWSVMVCCLALAVIMSGCSDGGDSAAAGAVLLQGTIPSVVFPHQIFKIEVIGSLMERCFIPP